MNKLRLLFVVLLVVLVLCSALINTYAQGDGTQPAGGDWQGEFDIPGQPDQIDRTTGQLNVKSPGLAERIQLLGARATEKLNYLQTEIVNYFSGWSLQMAQLLSAVLIIFGWLKLMREQEGKAEFNVWAWFVRLGIFLSLIGASPALLTDMYAIGNDIATGSSGNGVMFKFYDYNVANFEESYAKLTTNQFKVRIPEGGEYPVMPVDGVDKFLGVLKDQTGTARDFKAKLDDSTYTLPILYGWLGACRTLMELANFILAVLSSILLMSFRILAPFMMVVAIDRQLAQRITYPFVWGAIVLTLIWPPVSYFIRGFAYLVGNVAMALGDSDPVHTWNEQTLQAFRVGSSDPFYTVLFSCFVMTIAGLSLLISPYIAYQISMGRVYEGVSTAVSQFAGGIVGAAVEFYSSTMGSLLGREIGQMQANAGYAAETTRAGAERRAADLGVRGRQIAAEAGIRGGLKEKLGELGARKTLQLNSIGATNKQQNDQARLGKYLEQLSDFNQEGREHSDNRVNSQQQAGGITAGLDTVVAGGLSSAASSTAYALGRSGTATQTLAAGLTGGLLQTYGGAYSSADQLSALYKAEQDRSSNIDISHLGNRAISQHYLDGVQKGVTFVDGKADFTHGRSDLPGALKINDDFATSMTNQTTAYMKDTEKAIHAGTNIQLGGIRQETNMGLQANQVRLDAQIEASGITRDAAFKAADMHLQEAIIRAAGSAISHELRNAIAQRY